MLQHPSSREHLAAFFTLTLALGGAWSCAQGAGASLLPIPPQTVAVNDTLRVPLMVSNGTGTLGFRFEGPDLPGLDRTASISGNASGGEFRWTPLASHIGRHDMTFLLIGKGGEELDRTTTVVTVAPAADAAPIFVLPGAGGTHDLERDPCITFDVEVRDDDSPEVVIRARNPMPEGASLIREGPKRAEFRWCPTPDQVDAAERWTIELEADDGEHLPTPHNYIIVLRTAPRAGCPGEAPTVRILAPTPGTRVESEPGFTVTVEVTDDLGLRDAPLLYYTTTAPDDFTSPDLSTFAQREFDVRGGDQYVVRIPSLGLSEGAEQSVYVLVSATDNDDPAGSTCDHRTDSALLSFTATGRAGGFAVLTVCEACAGSIECASGICATAAMGARCLPTCDASPCTLGTCGNVTTSEGGLSRACSDVATVCEGGTGCTNDGHEPNESILGAPDFGASPMPGMICAGDNDYFRIPSSTGTEITVTVRGFVSASGDLDLQLLTPDGMIVAASGSGSNMESASYCLSSDSELYARVYGNGGSDENAYQLIVEEGATACCVDDGGEPDDLRTAPRNLRGGTFAGRICPGDDDFLAFSVTAPALIDVTLSFSHAAGDLDLELYAPDGSLLGRSVGVLNSEEIELNVAEDGTYVARVLGFRDAGGDYTGTVAVTAVTSCRDSTECPLAEVCDAGTCVSDSCTSDSSCPTGHTCPLSGPGSPASHCALECSVNSDCRSAEACKRFIEGRGCGLRGDGGNGDSCGTFADCGGQRACLPTSGGYCARAGCASNSDCESGTFCVQVSGVRACALGCWSSSTACRIGEGYSCRLLSDLGGSSQFVCAP